mgnify:CR=1 FL=1
MCLRLRSLIQERRPRASRAGASEAPASSYRLGVLVGDCAWLDGPVGGLVVGVDRDNPVGIPEAAGVIIAVNVDYAISVRVAARVGFVFQNPDDQLFERTVIGEVAFGPKNLGLSSEEARAAALEALGRHYVSDRGILDMLIPLFSQTSSWSVQAAIAGILIRADRRAIDKERPDTVP